MKKFNAQDTDKSKNNKSKNKSEIYHSLSKLDLKILVREINDSFNNFLKSNNLSKKGKIFLSGRNSQHKNLVKLLGESLKMDVFLISPINHSYLKEFSYNPDEINQFSMSRLIGLGLTLIKNYDLEDESLYKEFIVQDFTYKDDKKEEEKEEDIQKDNKELAGKFAKYDIALWGLENPEAAEKTINRAVRHVNRCMEIASGAEVIPNDFYNRQCKELMRERFKEAGIPYEQPDEEVSE